MLQEAISLLARDVVARVGGSAPLAEVLQSVLANLGDFPMAPEGLRDVVHTVLRQQTVAEGPLTVVGDDLVDLTVVTDGLVFTHRLTVDERTANALDLDPDLSVLARVAEADGGLHLDDGSPVSLRTIRRRRGGRAGTNLLRRRLLGPTGWLDRWCEGDVLGVSASGGFINVAVAEAANPAPAPDPATASASPGTGDTVDPHGFSSSFDTCNEGDSSPVWVEEMQAAGLLSGWYTAGPVAAPFGGLIEGAGFEHDGGSVGRPDRWDTHARLTDMIGIYARHLQHLDEHQSEPFIEFIRTFDSWRDDRSHAPNPNLLSQLRRDPQSAACLEEELAQMDPEGRDLVAFLGAFDSPTGSSRAMLDTLRALAADLAGDTASAESLIDSALRVSPDWFPAIDARIRLLDDRGQAQEAVNLLQRTRSPQDPELVVTRNRARATLTTVGRNQPCPCGSGRKFKHCHQGRDTIPTATRVGWLVDKGRSRVMRFAPRLLDDLSGPNGVVDEEGLTPLLALDIALFERGGMELLLRTRGSILPPEDVRLLEDWIPGHRPSVYRVEAMEGDDTAGTVTVTDQDDGARLDVHRTPAWDVAAVHELVWARLLPDGDEWWTSGLIRPARLAERSHLLAAVGGDPVDHFDALAGNDRPRQPQTGPDGEPLVEATSTWRVPGDRNLTTAALDAGLARQGSWWEVVDAGDDIAEVVLGHAGDDAISYTVTACSVAHHGRAVALLGQILPDSKNQGQLVIPAARADSFERDEDIRADLDEALEDGWDDGEDELLGVSE